MGVKVAFHLYDTRMFASKGPVLNMEKSQLPMYAEKVFVRDGWGDTVP